MDERLPSRSLPTGSLLIAALAAPFLVAWALTWDRTLLDHTNAALVLALVVVAVAAAGHRWSGLLAAASSALWFDFFLTRPYHHVTIDDAADVETAVLLVIVGVGVTELALWGRRHQAGASRRKGYLDGVMSAAREAATEQDRFAVGTFVASQIADVLGVDSCRYAAGAPPHSPHPRIHPDGSVTRDGRPLNVDRSGLPTDDEIEIPVHVDGREVGRFVLQSTTHVTWPSEEDRRVAVLLAEQAAR